MAATPGETDLSQETLHIEVKVEPPEATVFEPRDIVVTVQPKIGGVYVREVRLVTLGLLNASRPDIGNTKGSADLATSLAANETRDYRFSIEPLAKTKLISTPSLMKFPSGSQSMTARIRFDQPMVHRERSQDKKFDIRFAPDTLSVAGGGCVGGFVASIVVLAVRFQTRRGSRRFAAAIREIALNVVIGGGVAWILSYLGELTKQFNVGVTLSATSFQGGIVIGLFSYKLGQALVKGITLGPRPDNS